MKADGACGINIYWHIFFKSYVTINYIEPRGISLNGKKIFTAVFEAADYEEMAQDDSLMQSAIKIGTVSKISRAINPPTCAF